MRRNMGATGVRPPVLAYLPQGVKGGRWGPGERVKGRPGLAGGAVGGISPDSFLGQQSKSPRTSERGCVQNVTAGSKPNNAHATSRLEPRTLGGINLVGEPSVIYWDTRFSSHVSGALQPQSQISSSI